MATAAAQIGWIPYLNLQPMHHELLRITNGQFPLMTGHPTTVNRWLCDGTVGIAPCSSINLLKSDQLEIAMPVGIASEGKVLSVYLGAHREHAEVLEFIRKRQIQIAELFREVLASPETDMRRVAQKIAGKIEMTRGPLATFPLPAVQFTTASAASAALARMLLRMWFGEAQALQMGRTEPQNSGQSVGSFITGNRPLELVIGDEALARRTEFAHIVDLGEAWWDISGLPFVFAVWQSYQASIPTGIRTLLAEAASLSSARMKVEPQVYFPDPHPVDRVGNPLDLNAYWRAIQYKLTSRHLQGLLLYLALYSEWNSSSTNASVPMRMAKWAGLWNSM